MKKSIFLFVLILVSKAAYSARPVQIPNHYDWQTIEYVKQTTPWLISNNSAGLESLKTENLSEASLFFNKSNGDFINYNESDNSFTIGVGAESYYRLNKKVVLSGQIDYSYFQGLNMGGSYFIDPYNTPFDLVDCNDESLGKKRKETYHIMGGVSGRIHNKWILGGKFDYSALNFAKQKDLRHTNHLMDLVISPAIIFEANKQFSVGLDYIYQRKNEGIVFQTFGTTDQIYNSLVSYGAFWGTKEEYGTNGYTNGNEDKPLFDQYHQIHFQIDWGINDKVHIFNETGYKRRKGHYGVKSPNSIVHSNHNSHIATNSTTISIENARSKHFIKVGFDWEKLNNFENIYRHENEGGGLQNIEYYGQMETGHKRYWNLDVNYSVHFGLNKGLPTWLLQGGYKAYKRMIRASYYPYYRIQQLNTNAFNLSAQYNLRNKKNLYTFFLSAEYGYGHGDKAYDGTYTDTETGEINLQSNDDLLNKEFSYFTNRQMNYNIQAKYARQIKDTKIVGFCSINYNFAFAPKIQYFDGNQHHLIALVVGCQF